VLENLNKRISIIIDAQQSRLGGGRARNQAKKHEGERPEPRMPYNDNEKTSRDFERAGWRSVVAASEGLSGGRVFG